MLRRYTPVAAVLLVVCRPLVGAEPAPAREEVRAAVGRALPLIQKGGAGHRAQRSCFACHHQAIPMLALATAGARGWPRYEADLHKHRSHIADFLGKNRKAFREGRGTGGQADTAGYALWALELGGYKADDITAAVAEYLLRHDARRSHWHTSSNRPPSETSSFTTTYVAIRGLQTFGTPEQKKRIDERLRLARDWLEKTPVQDTEDRVFRLWALERAGAADRIVQAAAQELLRIQRPDGGWAQKESMQPDAYATGTALVALNQAGGLKTDAEAYRRGLKYLLSTQLRDGSWRVASRSDPFQTYFESGFPHGKDQFISLAASSWAATALALSLPVQDNRQAAGPEGPGRRPQ
jgi:hypothetical protein